MHITIATVFLVLSLIAAAPFHTERVVFMVEGNSHSFDSTQHPKMHKAHEIETMAHLEKCLRICASQDLKCPKGWASLLVEISWIRFTALDTTKT
ncbi:hypothetical protein B0J11DRAFT_545439 [Dendryphion nanum]|uniref:Uncharacterized protein n=1 Tax=Dendryphion nanum TaxID=256645 RepID=A0A9P9I5S3_9PLEO|nr:hypothetical protein B0J11DRAFT_545439 [Dendryphion nanum]